MKTNNVWQELYDQARGVQNGRDVSPFIYAGGVGAAIMTVDVHVYTGVSIDTACSLGMCAERNAIANMLTHGESKIARVVAVMPNGKPGSPCGACREYLMQLDEHSSEIEILLDIETMTTTTLGEIVPAWWGEERFLENN
ncbi:hypothetical protein FC62_GL000074 [Amylolactobacillus amylotrophicus DSM 20534]|uniref:Uncharacterized protein n=4 Tax=Amylolactobacillus TaxID=2767876 RepID=A0A0R1YT07_9LACO|nr:MULTISPECIES: cytidine deaminase [Amylolactobacillus]APT17899.1 cytidine deaminase [Amylolactobacillus amylophilus DSM 20533 = JCM 1125]KRK38391.1 hypothetical protein FC62_GL000074 [Amylolactobacillus amylotrophicus DSM 20534]KRM42966.1 hypothetical protein FD40_GL000765 [Amylolactobacillus amylophilus DSM 20533 = JCM 1125]GED79835.1 cytidine deaminase [Amylolactobacillus amylophilus]